MKIILYTTYVALCLLPFFSTTVNAAKGSASGSLGSSNAIAKVIKVTPSIDNDWIVAVADPKSPTGYSVQIKQYLNDNFVKPYFVVFMYARSNPKDKPESFFATTLCSLLEPNSKDYPKVNFLPRQVLNMILPGRYGSCNLKNSTEPMRAGGRVNTDPDTNKEVTFPKSSPFELLVNIMSRKQMDKPDTQYFFQVVLTVGGNGKVSGSVGGNTGGKKGASGGAGAKTGK